MGSDPQAYIWLGIPTEDDDTIYEYDNYDYEDEGEDLDEDERPRYLKFKALHDDPKFKDWDFISILEQKGIDTIFCAEDVIGVGVSLVSTAWDYGLEVLDFSALQSKADRLREKTCTLLNQCGFDCEPSDLKVYLTTDYS